MTVRESTVAEIEVEGREVTVDVVAPPRLKMAFGVLPQLPDALNVEEDPPLTPQEAVDTAHILIDATTDLPRDLIEQLPKSAIEELGSAASLVIEEQTRLWERSDGSEDGGSVGEGPTMGAEAQ